MARKKNPLTGEKNLGQSRLIVDVRPPRTVGLREREREREGEEGRERERYNNGSSNSAINDTIRERGNTVMTRNANSCRVKKVTDTQNQSEIINLGALFWDQKGDCHLKVTSLHP